MSITDGMFNNESNQIEDGRAIPLGTFQDRS